MSFSRRSTVKKKNNIVAYIFIIIGIFIVYLFSQFIGYNNFKNNNLITETTNISIKEGDTYGDVAIKIGLHERNFKIYKRFNEVPNLKVGNFQIQSGSTIEEIITSLQSPIFETENITLLEGWNIFDIDEYLTQKGLIGEGDYIAYAENPEKIIALTEFFPFLEGTITLEGYLYPDTYTIDRSLFAINKFVIFQLETFERKVYNKLFLDTDITIPNFQSVINLASIVEKEEKNKNFKKTVAGILKKRLKEGWMIGADITVCYPYRLTAHECKLVVTKYIRDKNEYNTRTMTGLPKTPIGNPSYETVEATLNHKDTNYYFYLHDIQTGQIYYAETNAQHEYNKSRYLR